MMWKSAKSYGWEYLVRLRGLGFESYAYHLGVILIIIICWAWKGII